MSGAPTTEAELLDRAHALAGLRLGEIASGIGFPPPGTARRTKGWTGALIEFVLGADAGNLPEPDFTRIGVELKTVPVDPRGVPRESTYVCRAPTMVLPEMQWDNSPVRRKLASVLWLPIEASTEVEIRRRRVGWAFLWRPSPSQEALLRADWEELIGLLATGGRDEITARLGQALQLRPKAADAEARAAGTDPDGAPSPMPPRGFYLRARFTRELLAASKEGAAG